MSATIGNPSEDFDTYSQCTNVIVNAVGLMRIVAPAVLVALVLGAPQSQPQVTRHTDENARTELATEAADAMEPTFVTAIYGMQPTRLNPFVETF